MSNLICNAPFCQNQRTNRKGYCSVHLYDREKRNIKKYVELLPVWCKKRCSIHGLLRIYDSITSNNKHYRCKICNKIRESKRERLPLTKTKRRETILKTRYKITQEEYINILNKQNYVCAICSCPQEITRFGKIKSFQIDHCHEKEAEGIILIRGLLCSRCNMGLGSFKDEIYLLEKAKQYLRPHKKT